MWHDQKTNSVAPELLGRVPGILLTLAALFLLAQGISPMTAKATTIEDFTIQPETRWRLITDQVMGGVSAGQVVFVQEDGRAHARMTGRVSTANRGGFIQMRLDLTGPLSEGSTGVRLVVRGNDQRYFVHLRTTDTVKPWHFYQAGFDVTRNWTEVSLPLDVFAASRRLSQTRVRLGNPTSLAIVAYGRDHEAEIEVREVGFY